MERLTEKFENEQVGTWGCGNNCKYNYRYCDNALENCPTIAEIFEKLADYEDAEEQGLLVKLPCKPGDTIYYVADGKITEKHVNGFLYTNQLYIVTEEFNFNCPAALIGHALFITREEAEAKLKEMESNHE